MLHNENSIQVEDLVRELWRWASKLPPVKIVYAARQKKHHWLKAANLNVALDLARRSAQGLVEFAAVLDIDMIPELA